MVGRWSTREALRLHTPATPCLKRKQRRQWRRRRRPHSSSKQDVPKTNYQKSHRQDRHQQRFHRCHETWHKQRQRRMEGGGGGGSPEVDDIHIGLVHRANHPLLGVDPLRHSPEDPRDFHPKRNERKGEPRQTEQGGRPSRIPAAHEKAHEEEEITTAAANGARRPGLRAS